MTIQTTCRSFGQYVFRQHNLSPIHSRVFTQNKNGNEDKLLECVRCHESSLLLYKVALVCPSPSIFKVTAMYVEGLFCIISSDMSSSTINITLQNGRRWVQVFV